MRRKVCPKCGKGELQEVGDIVSEIGGYVFVESGERCNSCGEEYINEPTSQRTIKIARKLGVWPEPLRLRRSLSRSGRGLILRIPSDLERDLKLKPGLEVALTKIGKKIVIEVG